jgi:integrase
MRVGDYKPQVGVLHIPISKSGKPRDIPLDPEGRAFFEALTVGRPLDEFMFEKYAHEPWGPKNQIDRMKAAVQRVPGLKLTFHGLRHTFASHLLMGGMSTITLMHLLGHADTREIERCYGHLTKGYIRDAVEQIGLRFGIVSPRGQKVSRLVPKPTANLDGHPERVRRSR